MIEGAGETPGGAWHAAHGLELQLAHPRDRQPPLIHQQRNPGVLRMHAVECTVPVLEPLSVP